MPDAQGEAMFGHVVVAHRRRLGLTQEELAATTGLSARAIRALEAGRVRVPRPSSARLLAEAFGLAGEQREAFISAATGAAPETVAVAPEPVAVDAPRVRTVHCLPRPATHFTGRDAELTRLASIVDRQSQGRPLVVTVDGMAGVGKTALALELAYRVAGRYTDGHVFVDLRGHSEDAPVTPSVALGLLLDQLGVPAKELSEGLAGRVARWRTELAGRRVLVVLDNAAESDQVRPLLPGMSSALVLVTSRRRLVGLDADHHVTLDPFDDDTAVALLAGVIGDGRLVGDTDAVRQVAALCGNLPLALRLAAARLRHRSAWTVGDLAAKLRAARPAVVELSAEGTTVAAALLLSYRQLTEPAGRLLRRLGLHGGEDLDAYGVAALADATQAEIRPIIDELLDAHLLQERDEERYRLHDLVHEYALRLASEVDSEADRRAAVRRLLEYYLHSLVADLPDGAVAGLLIPDWGPPSRHRRTFPVEADRARWEGVEWRNIIAAIDVAESYGLDRHVCLLTRAAWGFHYRRGNAGVLIRLNTAALAAAQRLGDVSLTGMAHNYLAGAYARGGRMAQSRNHLAQAVALWGDAGDTTAELIGLTNIMSVNMMDGRYDVAIAYGQRIADQLPDDEASEPVRRRLLINRANALRLLGECHVMCGRYRTSLGYLRQAAQRYWDPSGLESLDQAQALLNLGRAHARLGHRVTAPLLLRRALAVFVRWGNESGAAESLVELGLLHLHAGELREARHLHEWAVQRTERAGSPQAHCLTLNRLGGTLLRMGDAAAAAARHREALAIAQRVEFRYEEAVAHAGLAAALATVDPDAADRHAHEGRRLYAEMGAVDPYHVADGSATERLTR